MPGTPYTRGCGALAHEIAPGEARVMRAVEHSPAAARPVCDPLFKRPPIALHAQTDGTTQPPAS